MCVSQNNKLGSKLSMIARSHRKMGSLMMNEPRTIYLCWEADWLKKRKYSSTQHYNTIISDIGHSRWVELHTLSAWFIHFPRVLVRNTAVSSEYGAIKFNSDSPCWWSLPRSVSGIYSSRAKVTTSRLSPAHFSPPNLSWGKRGGYVHTLRILLHSNARTLQQHRVCLRNVAGDSTSNNQ